MRRRVRSRVPGEGGDRGQRGDEEKPILNAVQFGADGRRRRLYAYNGMMYELEEVVEERIP